MPRTPSPDDDLPRIGRAADPADEPEADGVRDAVDDAAGDPPEGERAETAVDAALAAAREQARALSVSERMDALARLLSDAEAAENRFNGRSPAASREFDAIMQNLAHFVDVDTPPASIDPEGGTPV